jgi:hypothetical protein
VKKLKMIIEKQLDQIMMLQTGPRETENEKFG